MRFITVGHILWPIRDCNCMHLIKQGKMKQYSLCFSSKNRGLREKPHSWSPFIQTVNFGDMKWPSRVLFLPYGQRRCWGARRCRCKQVNPNGGSKVMKQVQPQQATNIARCFPHSSCCTRLYKNQASNDWALKERGGRRTWGSRTCRIGVRERGIRLKLRNKFTKVVQE